MDVVKVAIESEMARTGCVMIKAVFGSTGDQSDPYITSFCYPLMPTYLRIPRNHLTHMIDTES